MKYHWLSTQQFNQYRYNLPLSIWYPLHDVRMTEALLSYNLGLTLHMSTTAVMHTWHYICKGTEGQQQSFEVLTYLNYELYYIKRGSCKV